jgi:hypothetical protein
VFSGYGYRLLQLPRACWAACCLQRLLCKDYSEPYKRPFDQAGQALLATIPLLFPLVYLRWRQSRRIPDSKRHLFLANSILVCRLEWSLDLDCFCTRPDASTEYNSYARAVGGDSDLCCSLWSFERLSLFFSCL